MVEYKENRRQIVINLNYIKESIKTTPLAKYLIIKSDVSFRIELLHSKKKSIRNSRKNIEMLRYVNCSFIYR